MTTRTLPLLALLLAGCPAEPVDRFPEETDTPDTGETDTTHEPPPVYPSGERILLFHGAGAPEADESGWAGFDDVDQHWKDAYGWNTDYRSYIPDELDDYRAIFFIAPGYTGEASFDPADLERLRGALDAGTRMIVITDKDGCAAYTPNELLEGLGATLRYSGDGLGAYQIAEIDQIAAHQATAGISALRFRDPCTIDLGDGQYLARYNEDIMIGLERPGEGGEVVLIGDIEFMDDSGPRDWANNSLFADRLVEIDPALAP